MSKPRRPASSTTHKYPRSARLNESLREVIAEELTRIDDERLDLVTITAIDVDAEMNRAIVFFDSLLGVDGDAGILEALGQHRIRLQSSIGRQVRAKKTPILSFKPDDVIRSAEHIQEILAKSATLPERPPAPDDVDDVDDVELDACDELDDEIETNPELDDAMGPRVGAKIHRHDI